MATNCRIRANSKAPPINATMRRREGRTVEFLLGGLSESLSIQETVIKR